ncbi:MAG: hypothetical protein IIC50_25720, partial [Planctomycetes bacterium]|nr:hypothetical protein [Planctomycetota bacterium]
EAQELIRTQQQGLGRPIISTDHAGYRVVAVGNKIRYSKKWKYFADFLSDYLKEILDPEWGNAEIKKPLADRHPILQLYNSYCTFQRSVEARPDGTWTAIATGVVHCYLGLAYNLYLLDHNAELQERLITRLKDPKRRTPRHSIKSPIGRTPTPGIERSLF